MSEQKKSGLEKQIDRAETKARAKLQEALGTWLVVYRAQKAASGLPIVKGPTVVAVRVKLGTTGTISVLDPQS